MRALILALALGAGCTHTTKVQRLRELPMRMVSGKQHPHWYDQRVVVRPFHDSRGDVWSESLWVPVFVSSSTHEYSEYAGAYSKDVIRMGGLERELPYLLAASLPGARTKVADDVHPAQVPKFDYVIEGRLLQARTSEKRSFALGALGILGVPAIFTRHRLRFEVTVTHESAPAVPLMRKEYQFDKRKSEGLYYNHNSARTLARTGLEDMVERAAKDIVAAVALDATKRLIRRG